MFHSIQVNLALGLPMYSTQTTPMQTSQSQKTVALVVLIHYLITYWSIVNWVPKKNSVKYEHPYMFISPL